MYRAQLSDEQWERIKDMLPGKKSDSGVTAKDNRLFVEAVLWIARTGSPWRDMHPCFGKWHSVYVRYDRWAKKDVWQKVFAELSGDADLEYLMVDGSIVRVHQHGAFKKNCQNQECQGRSRGGLSTKIHASVDSHGNPVRFILTGGQESEYAQADNLIAGFSPAYVIADRGYDSNAFVSSIIQAGAVAVIPPKCNRLEQRKYDKHLYKERNLVERLFQRMKEFRRIATRYEKLARNYEAMVTLVAVIIWLK
ncbi:IS5 family transposase [Denitrovibrio acetiphilus]|uniref:IS5 family transposase n=1 Tax=Denitrovibrio acetiphilus TaxID=118000 RepID=UPI001B7FC124|nr:IS5 family transposase [Denitrovibrio acetiphilus]